MFDLIDECGKELKGFGYKVTKLSSFGMSEGKMSIDSEQKSKETGLSKGEYFILNCPFLYDLVECQDETVHRLGKYFKKLSDILKLKAKMKILIVGLGNPDILADCLGKKVCDRVEIRENLFKFCPNVFYFTGIETAAIVSAVAKGIGAQAAIIIDALATNSITRLGGSIQLSSTGITPGSAIKKNNKKIDSSLLNIPCVSIGVPYMLFADALAKNSPEGMLLCPKDIHANVDVMSEVLAKTIGNFYSYLNRGSTK